MKPDILIPLLVLTAVSLGIGTLVSPHPIRGKPNFDERQLIEQGKAAQLSMNTAVSYLLLAYVAFVLDRIPMENMMIIMVFGLALTMMIYRAYCIFHDAYLDQEGNALLQAGMDLVMSVVWFILAFSRMNYAVESFWMNLILGISFAFEGVCMILRKLYLGWKSRSGEEE